MGSALEIIWSGPAKASAGGTQNSITLYRLMLKMIIVYGL